MVVVIRGLEMEDGSCINLENINSVEVLLFRSS